MLPMFALLGLLAVGLAGHDARADEGGAPAALDAGARDSGARIYREGRLAGDALLVGERRGREPVLGAAAACVNCHRPSGMGQVEADLQMPPITGAYLFGGPDALRRATMDPRVSKRFNQSHEPYTDATLARAVRQGVNSSGRAMSEVMPRFALGDGDMAALTAYLRHLSVDWSPGVTDTTISLATVVTPEVDPARRKAFLDMVESIVRQRNSSTVVAGQTRTRHHMATAAELVLGTERNWDLQVWALHGAPETWQAQLEARYRAHPVFALVSGLSDAAWQPVQDFCEAQQVPCWFPSVAAPGRRSGQYSFYFSGGVRLEASILAQVLSARTHAPRRLVQFYRDDALGRDAAHAFGEALAGSGLRVIDRAIAEGEPAAGTVRDAMADLTAQDAAVLWLRPADIQALDGLAAPVAEVYFSGSLAQGAQAPLPAAWRATAQLIYPYELPERRRHNLDYFHAWMNLGKQPLVDEAMQSEVFFAMSFLSDTLSEMLDNLYRDYLVERAETMLGRRELAKAEQETRDRTMLGREGELLRRRGPMTMEAGSRIAPAAQDDDPAAAQGTTLYPRLSLGPGQRWASKAGYLVKLGQEPGDAVVAQTPLVIVGGMRVAEPDTEPGRLHHAGGDTDRQLDGSGGNRQP